MISSHLIGKSSVWMQNSHNFLPIKADAKLDNLFRYGTNWASALTHNS